MGFRRLALRCPGPLSVRGGRGFRKLSSCRGGSAVPRGEDSGVRGGQSGVEGQGQRGGPYLLPAGPRRGAAGCGLLRVRPGRTPRGRRAAAGPRPAPPRDGERVRRSQASASVCQPAARGRGFLPGSVCVCARGDRARLKPPLSVTAHGESAAPHASPSRPARPPSPVCPAGQAPPPPGSGWEGGDRPPPPPTHFEAEGGGAGQWAPGGGVSGEGWKRGAGPRPLLPSCLEAGTIKSFGTAGTQEARMLGRPIPLCRRASGAQSKAFTRAHRPPFHPPQDTYSEKTLSFLPPTSSRFCLS